MPEHFPSVVIVGGGFGSLAAHERWIRHVHEILSGFLGGHSTKRANGDPNVIKNPYVSRTNSDFSCRTRNRSTPFDMGQLGRKLDKADSECHLRTTGSDSRAASPAVSFLPGGGSQSGRLTDCRSWVEQLIRGK
jgi:hypothetical protein